MKVEIALDPSQAVSLASRVAPAANRTGSIGRRGRPAGRGRIPRPVKKTAEELDADMAVCVISYQRGHVAHSQRSGLQRHDFCGVSDSIFGIRLVDSPCKCMKHACGRLQQSP